MSRIEQQLIARGFSPVKSGKAWRVRCDSCSPCVVNGVAIHEKGCPNDTHECRGCNALVPANVRYCGDCQ